MNSSTVRTDPDTFQALLHNSITWQVPEESYALELQLRIVEWLDYAVTQGLQSTIMTEEVGGLLLGRTEEGNCRRTIIDGFTPIPCEHTTGYLYHLSAKEKSVLREQVSRWAPGPGKHLVVVGFYRTHNREGLTLDNEDLAIANEFFSDPSHLILLIKPVDMRKSIGGIFYQKNGRFIAETTLQFPFSAKLLAERAKTGGKSAGYELLMETPLPISAVALPEAAHPAEREKREQTVAVPPLKSTTSEKLTPHVLGALPQVTDRTTPEPKQETGPPSPGAGADSHARPIFQYAAIERQSRALVKTAALRLWQGIRNTIPSIGWMHSGRLKWALSVGFLTLVLAGAGYLFRGLFVFGSAAKPAGDVAGLNLKVEKEQNLLYLSWNKGSSVVRSARAGIVSITDGGVDRTLNLDAAQLQSGCVAYYNRTNNLTFSLRVMADGTESSEWVRLTGVHPISGSAGAERVELKPAARGWGGPGPAKLARRKELSPLMQPLAAAAGAMTLIPQKGIAMEAISGVTAEDAGNRSAQSQLAVKSRIAPPTGAESNRTDPSAPPLPLEDTGNVATTSAAPDFAARTNYVEPRPVRSIEPFVPRSMRKLLPPGSRTKVKVKIDEQGKVTRAEAVAATNVDAFLTNLALDAARKWKFTPARRDGQKVVSELTLEFRFNRDK